ncbi:MAG: hypothetical protein ACI9P5_004828, partial [Saprospiraceae bacterium]
MRILFIFLIICCIQDNLHSQVPGYMGDRLSVAIGAQGMPNYNGRILPQLEGIGRRPDDVKSFRVNTGLSLDLSYCVSRKTSLVLALHRKSNLKYVPSVYMESNGDSFEDIFYTDETYSKIVTTKISLGVRIFRKDAIAPVGIYNEWGLSINLAKLDEDVTLYHAEYADEENFLNNNIYVYNDIDKVLTKSVILPLIYYGIGKKKMYSNGLFLDLNFRLHFPLILKDFGG